MVPSFDAVDHEMLKSCQFSKFLLWNMVHVCAIGNITKTIAQYRQAVVHSADGCYLYAVDAERLVVNYVHLPFRCAGIFLFCKSI